MGTGFFGPSQQRGHCTSRLQLRILKRSVPIAGIPPLRAVVGSLMHRSAGIGRHSFGPSYIGSLKRASVITGRASDSARTRGQQKTATELTQAAARRMPSEKSDRSVFVQDSGGGKAGLKTLALEKSHQRLAAVRVPFNVIADHIYGASVFPVRRVTCRFAMASGILPRRR